MLVEKCKVSNILLGAFAKLRKATVSFVKSVCSSVCPHGTTRLLPDGLSLNFIFECVLKKLSRKLKFLEKPDKKSGYFTQRKLEFFLLSQFFLE